MPPPRLPLPQGRYSPRSSVWGESEEGAGVWARSPGYDFPWASSSWGGGCRHIGSRDRGGGTCPPPRLPLPQGRYLPRSSVWGEPEEKTGVWVGDAGIFRLPLPRGDTPHGPVNVYPREGQAGRGYSCFMKRCSAVVLPRSGGQDVSGALERGPDLVPFEDDPVATQLGLRRPGVGVVAADQPPEPR